MKKEFWSTDRIVSFSAMFISLLTLIIFVWQTNIMEKQSRLSLMPYLAVEISNNEPELFHAITLHNYGVGPAIIERILIFNRDSTYEMDFARFAKTRIEEKDSIIILSSSSVDKGLAIPSGGMRTMLKVGGSERGYFNFLKLLEEFEIEGFDYEIRYRSIYDDRWKITNSEDIPEEL